MVITIAAVVECPPTASFTFKQFKTKQPLAAGAADCSQSRRDGVRSQGGVLPRTALSAGRRRYPSANLLYRVIERAVAAASANSTLLHQLQLCTLHLYRRCLAVCRTLFLPERYSTEQLECAKAKASPIGGIRVIVCLLFLTTISERCSLVSRKPRRHLSRMVPGETSLRRLSFASTMPPPLLLLLTIGGCLQAFVAGDTAAAARLELACDAGSREFDVSANSSWQSFTVLAAVQDFSGDCTIVVELPANTYNGTASAGWSSALSALQPRQQQPGLLLKLANLNLGPSSASCDYKANTLNIFVQNTTVQTGYICNVSSSAYMWASQAIKLYVYILRGSNSSAPYFAASFLNVASPINICQQQPIANGSSPSTSTSMAAAADLQVDGEAYVFAPDTRYSRVPPNNVTCVPDVNYTLTIAPSGSTSPASLNLSVLAAPPNGSCWSLLLEGRRCRSGDAISIAAGGRTTLVYARDGGGSANPGDCLSSLSSGFTVTATVIVAITTTTSTVVNTTTNTTAAASISSTTAASSSMGTSLHANSTVASFTVTTSTSSKALVSSTAAAGGQNSTTTGLPWTASLSTRASNGSLYSADVANSSSSSTTTVQLFAVAIGCSFAGGVVIGAAACAVAAAIAAHRNRKYRGHARKANLYSTNDDKADRSKPTAQHNLTYSKDFDTDI